MSRPLLAPPVVLLTHERLSDLVAQLERKVGATSVTGPGGLRRVAVGSTERRVLALVTAARDMLRDGSPVDLGGGPVLRPQLGRFAVLGTTGWELAGRAQGTSGPAWRTTLLRRGHADPDLARVVTRSTQFALEVGRRGLDRTAVPAERARVRAYALGMLCTLAGDVVTGPLLRDLAARRSRLEPPPGGPPLEAGLARERLLRVLLGPGADTRWGSWAPAAAEVPAALLEGYREAYEEVFGPDSAREPGTAAFEAALRGEGPLTEQRLRAASETVAAGAAVADWDWWVWLLVLSPALLAPAAGLLVARALPGSSSFTTSGAAVGERAVSDLLSVTAGVAALAPFGWSLWLWTQVPEHTGTFATAAALFGVRLAATLTTLLTSGSDVDPLVRWLLVLLPQLGTDVFAGLRGLSALGAGARGDALVLLVQVLPLATALLDLGVAALLSAVDDDTVWWVVWVVLLLGPLLGVGLPLALSLQHSFTLDALFTERPAVLDALRAGDLTALARVFDAAVLWTDPAGPGTLPAHARYPSGARPLLRLWSDSSAALAVAAHADVVTLTRGDGSTVDVRLPAGGATVGELAALLTAAVPGLHAEPLAPAEAAHPLPWPAGLAGPGDLEATLAGSAARAGHVVPLPHDRDDAVLLRHAPRTATSTTVGRSGPTGSRLDGSLLVPEVAAGEVDASAVGAAADLAVLLCAGAASRLADAPLAVAPLPGRALPADPVLQPVARVFQQWDLDLRRLEEWQALVAGGAPGPAGDPALADPEMVPTPAGYRSPAPAGRRTADALGWVGAFRAWARVATDLTADTASAERMPYTPSPPGGGPPPTNAELSEAVRYLLDLAP